jgi:ABC-type uncharacterized transport system auxiliary subunit
MHRITQVVPIALLAVGLGGCGAPKPITYYAVQIPSAPAPSKHTYAVDILVGRIGGPSLLESAPIVYRTGTSAIGTYQYHRWVDPPVHMVKAKLIRMLRGSGEYQSVGSLGSTPGAEFVVQGTLHEFAEVDGESITGLVTIEFELYNRKTAKILWSHFYSDREPVESKQIQDVVEALDRNLDRGLKEVVAGLGRYFAANPGKSSEASITGGRG